jgi:hypothetical protein
MPGGDNYLKISLGFSLGRAVIFYLKFIELPFGFL